MFITRAQYAPGLCVCVRLYVCVCVCVYMCVVKKHACLRLTVRNSPHKTHFAAMTTEFIVLRKPLQCPESLANDGFLIVYVHIRQRIARCPETVRPRVRP